MYGNHNGQSGAARLAADWQAQGGLAQLAAAAAEGARPASDSGTVGNAMQSPAAELPDEALLQHTRLDELMPAEPDTLADAAGHPDASMADRAQEAAMESPEQAVQPHQIDGRSPHLTAQRSPKPIVASPQQRVPTPVQHRLAQQQAKPVAAAPVSANKALLQSKPLSPVSPLAALVPSPGSHKKAAARDTASDLQAKATQLAMQVPAAAQKLASACISFTCSTADSRHMNAQYVKCNGQQISFKRMNHCDAVNTVKCTAYCH